MFKVVLLALGLLLFPASFCNSSGIYTIVAPQNIRSDSKYNVSISVYNQTEPVAMRIAIRSKDAKYRNVQEINVLPNTTQMVTLQLGKLNLYARHRLFVEALSGLECVHNASLGIETKNVSIFIQTDKAMYKPEEVIHFRVLVLDSKLRPVQWDQNSTSFLIYIEDADKNRIKQWKNGKLTKGVFASQFKLSKRPVLGHWQISVIIDGETKEKSIEIAEYELPKFQVKIETPKHVTAKDGIVRALVRSTYTFGKGVKGKGTVVFSAPGYYGGGDATSTFKIDGKAYVDFAIGSEIQSWFQYYNKDEIKCTLKASVSDQLTDKNATTTKELTLHKNRYKITSDGKNFEYRSGVPIRFNIALTYHDDTPVMLTDSNRDILIGQKYNDGSNMKYQRYQLNLNGTAKAKLIGEAKVFDVIIKYKDEDQNIGTFTPWSRKELAKFSVKLLTKQPILNQKILIEVEALKPMEYFIYQVISGGKLIDSNMIVVPTRTYHVFSIPASFELLPSAQLIVYYFEQQQIVSSKVKIEIKSANVRLANFVDLNLSTNQIEPSCSMNISVHSNPKSYIGLLGVDQSVLLLKDDNDLTIDHVLAEMYRYHAEIAYFGRRLNVFEDFESLEVILFTNAWKPPPPPIVSPYGGIRRHYYYSQSGSGRSASASLSSSMSSSSLSQHIASAPPSTRPPSHAFVGDVVVPVREEFPETWLWESIDDDDFNGTLIIQRKVPDTITSWTISAFSVNPVHGLGLMDTPKSLRVFQAFFASVNLPFSVIRDEVVTVPIVVQSYLDETVVAEITIHNEDGDFEFVDEENNSTSHAAVKQNLVSTIYPGDGATINVLIKFKKIGSIGVKVTAVSALAGDSLVKVVAVRPEGITQYVNKPTIIDLRKSKTFRTKIPIELPADDVVPDSLKIDVNCFGNIFGSTVQNLNNLIRLPSGCGEQNMLNFVPNIVILDYLKTVGELRTDVEGKIKSYTEIGYQGELSYRHNDGSFSVFGKLDLSGSTWLTAFVAKSFSQASDFIDIDASIIGSALEWLKKVQTSDGSFPEVGQVSHRPLQGGSGKGVALTSYVLITLLENKEFYPELKLAIESATFNIVKNIKDVNDTYVLAIAAYALQLANHEIKNEVLNRLVERSVSAGELKYWRKENPTAAYGYSKTLNVETTAYGFLALLHAKRFGDSVPYAEWLLNQRNSNGAFEGTQDTVVGLNALAAFAKLIPSSSNNLTISVTAGHEKQPILVNADNSMLMQKIEVENSVKSININAVGYGFALIDVSYRYNLNTAVDSPAFIIHPRMHWMSGYVDDDHIGVEICVNYNRNTSEESNDVSTPTSMVVLEVALPTGYTADTSIFERLITSNPLIKKVELKNGDTIVVIYFDYLEANRKVCPIVDAFRAQRVLRQKPVSIIVYDYYDSAIRSRTFYEKMAHTNCQGVLCTIPMPTQAIGIVSTSLCTNCLSIVPNFDSSKCVCENSIPATEPDVGYDDYLDD